MGVQQSRIVNINYLVYRLHTSLEELKSLMCSERGLSEEIGKILADARAFIDKDEAVRGKMWDGYLYIRVDDSLDTLEEIKEAAKILDKLSASIPPAQRGEVVGMSQYKNLLKVVLKTPNLQRDYLAYVRSIDDVDKKNYAAFYRRHALLMTEPSGGEVYWFAE